MFRSADPVRDWDRHCAEEERQLQRLPKCYECGEPITTEECYLINGEYICPECLKDNHRKWVEDIVS